MLWVTFVSISNMTAVYFHTSTLGVNALSIEYMALFIPGSILASYATTQCAALRLSCRATSAQGPR